MACEKQVLVCGAGGFIGGHLVKRLKREGLWVRGVDLKYHEFCESMVFPLLGPLETVRPESKKNSNYTHSAV